MRQLSMDSQCAQSVKFATSYIPKILALLGPFLQEFQFENLILLLNMFAKLSGLYDWERNSQVVYVLYETLDPYPKCTNHFTMQLSSLATQTLIAASSDFIERPLGLALINRMFLKYQDVTERLRSRVQISEIMRRYNQEVAFQDVYKTTMDAIEILRQMELNNTQQESQEQQLTEQRQIIQNLEDERNRLLEEEKALYLEKQRLLELREQNLRSRLQQMSEQNPEDDTLKQYWDQMSSDDSEEDQEIQIPDQTEQQFIETPQIHPNPQSSQQSPENIPLNSPETQEPPPQQESDPEDDESRKNMENENQRLQEEREYLLFEGERLTQLRDQLLQQRDNLLKERDRLAELRNLPEDQFESLMNAAFDQEGQEQEEQQEEEEEYQGEEEDDDELDVELSNEEILQKLAYMEAIHEQLEQQLKAKQEEEEELRQTRESLMEESIEIKRKLQEANLRYQEAMNEGINILQNMQDELELQETEAETEDQESD